MAYISKEQKELKAVRLKALAKEYGIKATVARKHCYTIVLNIQGGKIDFYGALKEVDSNYSKDYIQVNPYWLDDQFNKGVAHEFLTKALEIMNEGNYDNSDIMTDYFDRGFYVDINIGQWNKAYALAA
jgi:glycine cleavage system protein P-like pyridoxal-binding family